MITTAGSLQIVPQSPPSAPALRAADQGGGHALESVLSDNTRRVYGAQWRLFTGWCGEIGCASSRRNPSPWPATWPPAPVMAPVVDKSVAPPDRSALLCTPV